jgi:hypothetical protein
MKRLYKKLSSQLFNDRYNMMKIDAEKLYNLEWSLLRAKVSAKREWDEVKEFKGELIYKLRYEDVKQLRASMKFLNELRKELVMAGMMDYSSLENKV